MSLDVVLEQTDHSVMRRTSVVGSLLAFLGSAVVCSALQEPVVRSVDESVLREYAGVYQWAPDAFVYLQLWNEFTGFGKPGQLVAFDESGEVRVLYPAERDTFFTGPGIAIRTSVESRITFARDAAGRVTGFTRQHQGSASRTARRVDIEAREDVRFSNGDIRLAGTLTLLKTGTKHPAVILVHGSGAADRDYILPFARFLVRRGFAVLGYDKRGVGGSTGDWTTASFDDLATDVVAAYEYLKTRPDIDAGKIGLLGVSQAGWVMPIAAVRAPGIAFLISVSGAGVAPAETNLDNARSEMTAARMPAVAIEQILDLMRIQYRFAQTGEGWDDYVTAREQLSNRMGAAPPPSFPATKDDPLWQTMRAFYFYDPGPTLRRLRTPTLAIFGALDRNILPDKNKQAWEAALKAAGNPDYTVRILPNANHLQWEAKVGTNAEMPSLNGFVPEYFRTIEEWLNKLTGGPVPGQ